VSSRSEPVYLFWPSDNFCITSSRLNQNSGSLGCLSVVEPYWLAQYSVVRLREGVPLLRSLRRSSAGCVTALRKRSFYLHRSGLSDR